MWFRSIVWAMKQMPAYGDLVVKFTSSSFSSSHSRCLLRVWVFLMRKIYSGSASRINNDKHNFSVFPSWWIMTLLPSSLALLGLEPWGIVGRWIFINLRKLSLSIDPVSRNHTEANSSRRTQNKGSLAVWFPMQSIKQTNASALHLFPARWTSCRAWNVNFNAQSGGGITSFISNVSRPMFPRHANGLFFLPTFNVPTELWPLWLDFAIKTVSCDVIPRIAARRRLWESLRWMRMHRSGGMKYFSFSLLCCDLWFLWFTCFSIFSTQKNFVKHFCIIKEIICSNGIDFSSAVRGRNDMMSRGLFRWGLNCASERFREWLMMSPDGLWNSHLKHMRWHDKHFVDYQSRPRSETSAISNIYSVIHSSGAACLNVIPICYFQFVKIDFISKLISRRMKHSANA